MTYTLHLYNSITSLIINNVVETSKFFYKFIILLQRYWKVEGDSYYSSCVQLFARFNLFNRASFLYFNNMWSIYRKYSSNLYYLYLSWIYRVSTCRFHKIMWLFISLLFVLYLLHSITVLRHLEVQIKKVDIQVDTGHGFNPDSPLKQNRTIEKKMSNAKSLLERKKILEDTSSRRIIEVETMSSKYKFYVRINGTPFYNYTVKDENIRGIHVVVISEYTGHVMAHSYFDTYSGDGGEIVNFVNSIQNGRLLVFLIVDEGSSQLKRDTRIFITSYGSKYIEKLGFRQTWVFACKKAYYSLGESYNKYRKPCFLNFEHELEKEELSCNWKNDLSGQKRSSFCSKYEGFGKLCDCIKPLDIDLKAPLLPGSRVNDLPIAVMASNRPQYLFRMLKGLMMTPGVDRKMVTVFIDGLHDVPADLTALFQVNYVAYKRVYVKNSAISHHYKRSLSYTFSKYKTAQYMIILEEDLDVAPDIMDYFTQLLPVLDSDESVYCISAWNDQGYKHSSNDSSMLYRVESMPGLGWVLKRKLFIDELEPKWPSPKIPHDWDMWMRMDYIKKGRECIIPDISRTFHFGVTGVNMNAYMHQIYFKNHSINKKIGIKFEISKMTKNDYEIEMHKIIKYAEVLDHTKNPCSHNDFVPNTKNHTYVFYIRYSNDHTETWTNIAACFNIWAHDVRGYHKQMFRLWMKENRLIVVGSSSPYAMYKPKNVIPIFIPKHKTNDE